LLGPVRRTAAPRGGRPPREADGDQGRRRADQGRPLQRL